VNDQPAEPATARKERVARFLRPSPHAWRGAATGIAILATVLILRRAAGVQPWSWAFALWALVLLFLTSALASLIFDEILPKFPPLFRNVTTGAAVIIVLMLLGSIAAAGQALLTILLLLGAALTGGGVAGLAASREPDLPRKATAAALLGFALLAALLILYRWPGPPANPATRFPAAAISLPAGNPAEPGPYAIATLTYGSGADRRPLYDNPDLLTKPVDGRSYVANWNGLTGTLRTRYWGFDAAALPLNARVWYPQGDGPFPLALIVHGNHEMAAPSEAGYAYLAEHLASRGITAVYVDQNFLNGTWTDLLPFGERNGLSQENDARAWLLLEHLRQWRAWTAAPGNPVSGKADLDRVALIGHSRGGEAAAIAAAFNTLPHYPDNARRRFDYHFGIQAVVAIAAVDGQYEPGGRPTPLAGVSYLALHGAYDGDLTYFDGLNQYHRVDLGADPTRFKAAVYVDQANHGQFNTEWGRTDRSDFPSPGLLNLGAIMDPAHQRTFATVFITAFLEATLHGYDAYRSLFQQPGAAAPWLPPVAYRTRYDDAHTRPLATFDEDLNVLTATAPGVTLRASGLTGWKEDMAPLKSGDQGSAALWLKWNGGGRYTLSLAANAPQPGDTLTLALAPGASATTPLDFTVELADRAGHTATLPLSAIAPLPPQIVYTPWKHPLLARRDPAGEPIFQTYHLPLAQFTAAPAFDPTTLAEITLAFDRSEEGEIWLDDVGWR
jgi:dienelactone hydrolase